MRTFPRVLPAVVILAASLIPAVAQNDDLRNGPGVETAPRTPSGQRYKAQAPDAQLKHLLNQINESNLEATVQKLVSFGTRHTSSSQTDPVRGIGAATSWVTQQMQSYAASSGGNMTVQEQSFVQPVSANIPVPTQITNIIATVNGSDPTNRSYVVVAHLDSRATNVLDFTSDAPGADSDASGVAVVLELARIMASQKPNASIIFSVVAGSEQGRYGSGFEAAQLAAASVDVKGVLNVDRVGSITAQDGGTDPHKIRLFTEGVPTSATPLDISILQAAGGEDDSSSRELGRFTKSVAENDATDMTIWLINRRDRILAGGDQISFSSHGYPAARFTEPNENFDHEDQNVQVVSGVQLGDLAEYLDFGFMARVARVNAAALWSLAEGPGTPKSVQLHITPPAGFTGTNSTTLTWNAGSDPDLAGYEVVWRNMDDSDWTHVIPVGNVTTVTFGFFAKDNFIIGVRAVDNSKHHSPVAYAVPSP